MRKKSYILKAIGLSILAGMRAMATPAILSHKFSHYPSAAIESSLLLHYLQSGRLATGLRWLAAFEMASDKMPGIPNRIELPGLLARSMAGALVGAAVFAAGKGSTAQGAVLGAVTASAATYGSFYLRKALSKNTPLPDAAYGALEDALVVASGVAVYKLN